METFGSAVVCMITCVASGIRFRCGHVQNSLPVDSNWFNKSVGAVWSWKSFSNSGKVYNNKVFLTRDTLSKNVRIQSLAQNQFELMSTSKHARRLRADYHVLYKSGNLQNPARKFLV